MKRFVCAMVAMVLMVSLFPFPVFASGDAEIVYFEDGSYMTIEIISLMSRASEQVSGVKQYTHYGDNGAALWRAVLRGNFLCTGTNATCTHSACDVTIYDTSWYTVSKSPAMLGNKASCDLTMGRKVLGVTVSKVPISMVLTCDANGNLS